MGDILRSRSDTADGKENVVMEKVLSEDLYLLGEGSWEHERLPLAGLGHVVALDDLTDLGFETHV